VSTLYIIQSYAHTREQFSGLFVLTCFHFAVVVVWYNRLPGRLVFEMICYLMSGHFTLLAHLLIL